jgi:hypothetical protein
MAGQSLFSGRGSFWPKSGKNKEFINFGIVG